MSEEEELKQKKMEELQKQYLQQQANAEKQNQQEQEIDLLARTVLTPEAKARLANIKMVNPEKYLKVIQQLMMFLRSGKLREKISDEQLKKLLEMLSEKKPEFTIKRK